MPQTRKDVLCTGEVTADFKIGSRNGGPNSGLVYNSYSLPTWDVRMGRLIDPRTILNILSFKASPLCTTIPPQSRASPKAAMSLKEISEKEGLDRAEVGNVRSDTSESLNNKEIGDVQREVANWTAAEEKALVRK